MVPAVSRRDFLKVASAMLAGSVLPGRVPSVPLADSERPNFIIILCDTFSAMHMSLYGYSRQTTPHLDAFAGRSTVFHKHYTAGNFTTSGTASMLTGMIPWKHRAISSDGLISRQFARTNPFTLLGSEYRRLAFAQNVWADRLVHQFPDDVDRFLPPSAYSLIEGRRVIGAFGGDPLLASIALEELLLPVQGDVPPGSPLLGYFNKSRMLHRARAQRPAGYPKGVPEVMNPGYLFPYLNEHIYDGVYTELAELALRAVPYLAYFHLWSPHYPYRARKDYRMLFRDGYAPTEKPNHRFSPGLHPDYVLTSRLLYDRQITQLDDEFDKLLSRLDRVGVLDSSYLIITSDHGELFERGFVGHGNRLLYEPVLRIPLIIQAPGQTERVDVFSPTSNIDLLPTLLDLAGRPPGSEVDGRVLPAAGAVASERAIFSINAVGNSAFLPIERAAIAMRKGEHKLIAYLGFTDSGPLFELYDLQADPEELTDLAARDRNRLTVMKNELLESLAAANRLFAQ